MQETLSLDLKQRLTEWHKGSILVETKKRHRIDQYLIGGKDVRMHGIAGYMKKVEERVTSKPPEINIAKITRSFYNPTADGQPIANVFRLNYIKKELQGGAHPTVKSHHTLGHESSSS